MRQLAMVTMAAVAIAGLAACGDRGAETAGGSGGGANNSPAGEETSSAKGGGAEECPLTQDEVDSAFGESLPVHNPAVQAVWFVCQFTAAPAGQAETDSAAFFEYPTVEVSKYEEAKTPAEVREAVEAAAAEFEMTPREHEELVGELIDQPSWGKGAFLELTTHQANEVSGVPYSVAELFLPSRKIVVIAPRSVGDIKPIAERIGDAAA